MTIESQTPPATPISFRAGINWREWLKRLGPLVGLLFVFGIFSVLRPTLFLSPANLQLMLMQTAVVGVAALGMTLIIISGGIDLSVGSNVALCSVVVALLLRAGVPPLVAALGGVAMGIFVGLIIGTLVTAVRLSPFIVTLGLMGALRGVAKGIADNGIISAPVTWLNDLLFPLEPGSAWMIFPPGVWILIVLALLVAGALRYTKFGRRLFAVGSNEQTARLCGVRIGRNKLLIYALGGGLAGVAGLLHFSYLTLGDPTSANGMELSVIAAVVIGGASLSGGEGGILGSLAGALMMTAVANGCQKMNYPNWVQEIVTGAIIILAATVDRLRHRQNS